MDLDEGVTPTETPGAKFKIFVPMVKAFREKAAGSDEEDFYLSGIASSTVKDLHGDRMEGTALKDMLRAAKGNLTIFLNHKYIVPGDVAGSVKKARLVQQSDSVVDLVFDKIRVNKRNEDAVEAFLSIEDGIKLGLSIGAIIPEGGAHFDPKQNGWVIEHVELLETSIVGVPANPRSWIDYAVKAMSGHYPEQFKNVIKRSGLEVATKDIGQWIREDEEGVDPQGIDPAIFEDASDELEVELHPAIVEDSGVPGQMHGIEVPEGMTVTVTVDKDGNSLTKVEPIGDGEVGFVGNLEPPVIEAAQTGDHQHPHAHSHDEEHTHGYGDDLLVHSHDHSHVHSHEHGADHDHQDLMNDYQHDHWHAGGVGDHAHDGMEASGDDAINAIAHSHPELVKDKAPDDTAQGAPPSNPETGVKETGDAEASANVEALVREAVEALGPVLMSSLESSADLIKALTSELSVAKKARDQAVVDRDAALQLAEKVMTGTTEILTQLSRLPVGKRAVAQKASTEFEGLQGYYDDKVIDVLRSMKK